VNLKQIALQLCTCTWIEIMTGAGITLYMIYVGNHMLAAITVGAFAPLILFHFVVDRLPKSNVEWRWQQQEQQQRHTRKIRLRV